VTLAQRIVVPSANDSAEGIMTALLCAQFKSISLRSILWFGEQFLSKSSRAVLPGHITVEAKNATS
jgi:hypothetical protein